MKAKKVAFLLKLHSSSSIYLRQLCNDNYKVILDKKELNVYKDKKILLKGYQNLKDNLWDIPIANSIIPNNFIILTTYSGMYLAHTKQQHLLTSKLVLDIAEEKGLGVEVEI